MIPSFRILSQNDCWSKLACHNLLHCRWPVVALALLSLLLSIESGQSARRRASIEHTGHFRLRREFSASLGVHDHVILEGDSFSKA